MTSRGTLLLVYFVCLMLLAATIGVAQLELGALNPLLNLSIASLKALLIAWFFMHLREGAASCGCSPRAPCSGS